MKQKIHREFILVALTTILLTTVVVTAVFYSFFKKEVMEELSTCAEVLSSTGVFQGANETDAEQISARLGLLVCPLSGRQMRRSRSSTRSMEEAGIMQS